MTENTLSKNIYQSPMDRTMLGCTTARFEFLSVCLICLYTVWKFKEPIGMSCFTLLVLFEIFTISLIEIYMHV